MGSSKKELFSKRQNEMADLARAIGHPARVAILEHLISTNECINSDLVNELGLAQATISQHLKELKKMGIIQGAIAGTSVCYCINPEKWTALKSAFNDFFDRHPCCSPGQNC